MKWPLAITALALLHQCVARGLKTPRGSSLSKLQAENEDLRKQNRHLEAMMQVARTEVRRLDAQHKDDNVAVLTLKLEDTQKKLHAVEADKKSLMQTLRQLLAKNSTKILRKQAEARQMVEVKYSKERDELVAQVKEANGRCDEVKEMTQTLQEQNLDLQRKVRDLQDKLDKTQKRDNELSIDKANLVATMHNLMRESSGYKKELQQEVQKENALTEKLAAEEAKLAKLSSPKAKKNAQKQQPVPKVSKTVHIKQASNIKPMHLNHEESMASKMAHLKDINRYLDRANMPDIPDDELESQLDEQPTPEELFARGQHELPKVQVQDAQEHATAGPKMKVAADAATVGESKGANEWLGVKEAVVAVSKPEEGAPPKDADGLSPIDALDPQAVTQEKATQAKKQKADEDDGGDGIENLLSQAKDQLSAMDAAEAETSA